MTLADLKYTFFNALGGTDGSIDSSTNAIETIDYAHHEIHAGSAFVLSATDLDLDTAQVLSIAFTTPNTAKYFHVVASGSNTSNSEWEILEGPTITVDTGSDLVIYNRNRNSLAASGALNIKTVPAAGATLTPTITVDGTILEAETIGAGKNQSTGVTRSDAEWILKPNTTYAFRITGLADNGTASVRLFWYEHTDKN